MNETNYTLGEEIGHCLTHGIGAVLSIAALTVMVALATLHGDAWHIASCSIFGTTLVLMYTASTLYHGVQAPRAKRVLRVLDHVAIFLLIAGTYTPFALVNMRGDWGWATFGAIWGCALVGIGFKVLSSHRYRSVTVLCYLVMGWLVVLAARPLCRNVPAEGLLFLGLGGLFYTGGVGFYLWRRLRYNHVVWHGFVLAGSTMHFFAVVNGTLLP